jgi:tetratricopeptide (TPR) repeat protein
MKPATFVDDLPADDAIIALEETEHGWRGLTAKGEVLDVRGRDGHKAALPDGDVLQMQGGKAVSRRPIVKLGDLDHSVFVAVNRSEQCIDEYLTHFDCARDFAQRNLNEAALAEYEAALALAPTLFARFNRALILLALGRWQEGFAEFTACEQSPPLTRPAVTEALAAGLKLWDREELAGKRLLLLQAHGFGDTIMTLRYVPLLRAIGADVTLKLPPELHRLAAPIAPVTDQLQDADFVCPMLYLVEMLAGAPGSVNAAEAYLRVEPEAIEAWRAKLGPGPHIGLAWSSSMQRPGDYPRSIPLGRLVAALGDANLHNLHSVQKQGGIEAIAHGVHVHEIGDFADCAALMLAMDRIVTVDTAALHLAGAIGHPRVDGLLSHWASWRWLAPWYQNVRLHRQTMPEHWDSALAQLA